MTQKYRADGWPLCPECEEDELWSTFIPADTTKFLKCCRCNWNGIIPPDRMLKEIYAREHEDKR